MNFETIIPEDAGMSSARLLKAKEYAQRVSDQLGGSGGAVLVARHDKIVGEWYWGQRGPEDTHPYDANTMTPLYSVTKGFTAMALSLLIQDGALWLDEPAWLHVPELKDGDLAKITIRHLATHSSGFPGEDPDYASCWQDQRPGEHLAQTYFRHAIGRVRRGVVFEPGTAHIYSDPAVIVLGEIIYRVSGERVPDLLSKRVFAPLGLERIGWDFQDARVNDIATIVNRDWVSHMPDARIMRQGASAAGGLIS